MPKPTGKPSSDPAIQNGFNFSVGERIAAHAAQNIIETTAKANAVNIT
jgi:hypothetical protein